MSPRKGVISEKNPDILCVQEYTTLDKTRFTQFPYRQIFKEGKNIIVGNAIFSKFKIINKGKIVEDASISELGKNLEKVFREKTK